MSVIKCEEMIKSGLEESPLNKNINFEKGKGLNEHLINVVKAEENEIKVALNCGYSSVNGESVTSDIGQVNDHCITVNVEATQLFKAIKSEPAVLDDFIKTTPFVQNVNSDKIKIEPVKLSNILKTERCNSIMDVVPYTTNNIVDGDGDEVVKTELDDSETMVQTKIGDSEKAVEIKVDDSEIVVKKEVGDSEIVVKTEVGDSEIVVKTEIDDREIVVKTEVDNSEILVETEIDEPYMFEYPEKMTDEVNKPVCFDDNEDSLHIPHIHKICKQGFSQNNDLGRHMLSHDVCESKERKYKYNICAKDDFYEKHLKRHTLSHNAEPCLCHICDKNIVAEYYLRQHIRAHESRQSSQSDSSDSLHRSNSFVCLWCGKAFFNSADFRKQVKKCEKKPHKKPTPAFSQNKNSEVLSQATSMMPPKRKYIPILPSKTRVLPMISSIQSNSAIKSMIPVDIATPAGQPNCEKICTRPNSKSKTIISNQSLTKNESKPISDVKAKPETIEKLSSLIRTRQANTATIPITKS